MATSSVNGTVVIRLTENGTLTTRDLTADQARLLALQPGKYFTVQRSWEPGEYTLTAGRYIGTIVSEGIHVQIEPKVAIENLFFMLTYAYKLAAFRPPPELIGPSEAIFDLIVQIFIKQVDQIVRDGIQRGYVDCEEDHQYLRGRLRLAEQLRREQVAPGRFHQYTNEFTADLLENRVLHETLNNLARVTYRNGREQRRLIRRSASAFAEVNYAPISPTDCDRVVYTRLNERYRAPVRLARLLLQHLSLESRAGQTPFATYLLPMHDVFEDFVTYYLKEALGSRPRFDVVAQKNLRLDADGQLTGTPDIELRYDHRPFAVLDTKYKAYGEKPTTDDVFQVFTYAKILGVNRAVLVYPGEDQDQRYLMKGGVALDMRPLSLAGTLDQFEMRCRAFAERLVAEMADAEAAI